MYTFPEKQCNSSFLVQYQIIFNNVSYGEAQQEQQPSWKNHLLGVFPYEDFGVTKREPRPIVDSKEAAEENLKARAGKVKVYGLERMKATMTLPSAGWYSLASAVLAYRTCSRTGSV